MPRARAGRGKCGKGADERHGEADGGRTHVEYLPCRGVQTTIRGRASSRNLADATGRTARVWLWSLLFGVRLVFSPTTMQSATRRVDTAVGSRSAAREPRPLASIGGSAGPHSVTPRGFLAPPVTAPTTDRAGGLQRAPTAVSTRRATLVSPRQNLVPAATRRVRPGFRAWPVEACRASVSRTRAPAAGDARHGVSGAPCRSHETARLRRACPAC